MIKISSDKLEAKISKHGAELTSLIFDNKEIIYQKDGAWNRQAPCLFPLIGKQENQRYMYKGEYYPMSNHGFARDSEFEILAQGEDFVTLELLASAETKKMYPFLFRLLVSYHVSGNKLVKEVTIKNLDDKRMYFNYGEHPAFIIDEDNSSVVMARPSEYMLLNDNHKLDNSYPFTNPLNIKEDLFENDAFIFKESANMYLYTRGLKITLKPRGFDHNGIWSNDKKFVCLEPWYGCCNYESDPEEITKRETVHSLNAFGQKYLKMTIKIESI